MPPAVRIRIDELQWDEDSEAHIWRHKIEPEDVENVVFADEVLVYRTKDGPNFRRYLLLGAHEGLHLTVIIDYLGHGIGRVVTARDMSDSERRLFNRR